MGYFQLNIIYASVHILYLINKALMLCPECEPVSLDKDSTSWVMGEDYQSTDAFEI